jgi:predicted  nucleic acid-binding Zn-ribbon protein
MERLLELSRLDARLAAFQQEQAEIPRRRARIAEARAAAEQRIAAARESVAGSETAQRRAESDLRDHEAQLAKLESQQHQVKTNEAFRALLAEMDRARAAMSDCETRILEAMDATLAASAERDLAEKQARAEGGLLESEERALGAREAVLEREARELRAARERLCAGLDRELLERYQKVAARRQPAVALVSGETCSGCRVGIPPQLYIEVLKAERLVSCESCHRILLPRERLAGLAARRAADAERPDGTPV